MGKNTVPLTGRVPEPLKDRVGELAEAEQMSKSAMVRELVKDGIEHREDNNDEDDTAPSRSVSPAALLGVVALAIAPTLLATGYTGLGVAAGSVAAVYVLLWVTGYDVLVEDRLGDVHETLVEVGGAFGFVWYLTGKKTIEELDLVERAADGKTLGLGFLIGVCVVGAPAVVLARVGYLELVLDAIGPTGALTYAALLVGLGYAGALLIGISAIASLAIASARTDPSPRAGDDLDA